MKFQNSKECILAGKKKLDLENSVRFGKAENVVYQTGGE